jgi:ubiquitin carboxyl-terminal hydrolase 7
VSAAFVAEGFAKEKRLDKRWKVGATATESGIEQAWGLVVFPKGDTGHKGFVSAHATFDAKGKPFASGWYLDVRMKLVLKHLKDETQHVFKESVFRFSEKEPTHGWEEFAPSDLILKDKDNSYSEVLTGNPHFVFEVQIVREKGCSGAFRAGFQHDSFKATGFCGLKNQGATCYLNSLLQALYWIAPFRASVYRLPTDDDQPNASIPLALQRLFYRLQFFNAPVSTTELTNSFGWGTRDVFTQHDVQELNRVLQDKIEEKMRGTTEEGTVAKLFRGKMVSYIKCLRVDYESKREEEFYDVSLVVKGCKNVYESFDKYTETELLNGDNQYRAENHGLQDAEKGVRFIQFPPVLHLQLKRFDFDLNALRNYKIHSRYEFPRELDLRKYVDANSPFKGDPAVYVLQGVMVHSGTAGGGHYYAYFRPTSRKRWYKFNDMKVTKGKCVLMSRKSDYTERADI